MSIQFLSIFSTTEKKTVIHQLDPRAKGFIFLCIALLAFLFNSFMLQVLFLFLLLPFVFISHTLKTILDGISGLFMIFFFILLMNTYFISLNHALTTILRIINLLIGMSLYFQTTNPDDVMQSMITMHFPYNLAFAFSLSFRFIPTLSQEMLIIHDAQKSRGHRIEEGNFIQKIYNWFPILIPLLLNSINRAFHVAEALETRGFGYNQKITSYFPLKLTLKDYIGIIVSFLLLILGFFLRFKSNLFPSGLFWNFSV